MIHLLAALVAAAINLAGAYLNYVIWSGGEFAGSFYNDLERSALGIDVISYIVLGAGLGVTLLAYIITLIRRRKWPAVPVFLIWGTFGVFLAGFLLGSTRVTSDNFPLLGAGSAAGLLVGVIALLKERAFAMIAMRAARAAESAASPAQAALYARIALIFSPGNADAAHVLAYAAAETGDVASAQEVLLADYTAGDRSTRLLKLLLRLHAQNRDPAAELVVLDELQAVEPSPDRFKHAIELLMLTGQREEALRRLQALPEAERAHWAESIRQLILDLERVDDVLALSREYEQYGPPYSKARELLNTMRQRLPENVPVLERLAEVTHLAGIESESAQLDEELLALGQDRPARRRQLVAYYSAIHNRVERQRHFLHLVDAGDATLIELIEHLEELRTASNTTAMEALFRQYPLLERSPEALAKLALAVHDEGRSEETLSLISRARAAGEIPEAVKFELSQLEARIRKQQIDHDLTHLASRVDKHPEDAESRRRYYNALIETGSTDRVIAHMERRISAGPDALNAIRREISELIDAHPRNHRLQSYRADFHLGERDWDRVFYLYEEMARDSLDPEGLRLQAARKILEHEPAHVPSLAESLRAAARTADHAEVIAFADRLRAAGAEPAEDILRLEFAAAEALRQLDRAIATGNAIRTLAPKDSAHLVRLGALLLERRDFDDAIAALEAAAELEPDDADIAITLRQYRDAKKRARIEWLRARLAEDPNRYDLHEELGDLHHDFEQLNEAIGEYQKAALGDSSRYVARAKLAYVLARKELFTDTDEALAHVELRVDMSPAEQDRIKRLLYETGLILEQERQDARALSVYRRIFRVDAVYRDVVGKIERLQRLEKPKPR